MFLVKYGYWYTNAIRNCQGMEIQVRNLQSNPRPDRVRAKASPWQLNTHDVHTVLDRFSKRTNAVKPDTPGHGTFLVDVAYGPLYAVEGSTDCGLHNRAIWLAADAERRKA